MSYITPVTNRTQADVTNKTSKGYWNIADWTRVYNNSKVVNSLAWIMLGGGTILFNDLATPTTATIPTATDFNTFLANIERTRLRVYEDSDPQLTTIWIEIKDDYLAGVGGESPDYADANLWEITLDAIWNYYGGPDLDDCITLGQDLTLTTGNQAIYVSCINMADYNIDLQGTARLYII